MLSPRVERVGTQPAAESPRKMTMTVDEVCEGKDITELSDDKIRKSEILPPKNEEIKTAEPLRLLTPDNSQ